MKLDRNTNEDGRGKYALVNMRLLIPRLDRVSKDPECNVDLVVDAFDLLVREGVITLGNETPGDQFFVMKYKDRLTPHALRAYSFAAGIEATCLKAAGHHDAAAELHEFAGEMSREAQNAESISYRLPD